MEILDVQKQKCLFGLIEKGAHELSLELLKGENHFTKDELNKSLISACQHGYKFIVQMLVRLGADVNYRGTNANTPLLISVQNGLTDIVHYLLINKADVNASNSVGNSALILSIRPSGSTEIAANLLKQPGINIDHQNQDGYTAIMKAAEVKDIDALKILLDKYFNIHSISASKPLDECIAECKMHEHTSDNVTHYVSQWTTLDKTVNTKGENAHQIAERCGIGNVLKLLQEHISKQISPLELAMRENDIKSFNIFIDCDFVYASDKKFLDKVFLNIFQTCSDKEDLHFNENEIAMIKALLEHGVQVKTCSTSFSLQRSWYCKKQMDPIQIAAKSGCVKVLELLLLFEADANRYDFPNSPLHIALSHGHTECAKLLIQHGANIEFIQALKLAVDQQEPKYVRFLTENCKNEFQKEPKYVRFLTENCKNEFQKEPKYVRFLTENCKNEFQKEPKYVRFLTENCKNEFTKEPKYARSLIGSYKGKIKKHSNRTSEIQDILLSSVRKGNLEIIGQILDLGANINDVMDSYTCPLAESKNGDVAKFLIDRGAKVNYIINPGAASSTPLITVLYGRKIDDSSVVEVIQVLLENGASANETRWCGKTALMLAAMKKGSRSVLQLLLDHGAEIGDRDKGGNTALIHAVRIECPQNVLFLLQFITDRKQLLNVQDNCGFTALMYAVMQNNKSIIGQLIDQGTDVNIKDTNGDTALHILLTSGKHEDETIRSLIQAGCDVNCQNNKGISPLMLAAEHCLRDTISVLLDSGAEINAVSNKDVTKTALAHLLNRPNIESRHFNCLGYLLDRGASSSYVGAIAFHKMIAAGQIQVIPKLIKCGFGPASIKPESISSLIGVCGIMRFCSPLLTALYVGNGALSRFFVGNMFLTHSDVSLLSHNKLIRQHLERRNYKECLDILNELSTQPMTLFNLSFVRVSTAVGATPGREVRVNKLPVPQIIKDKLLFKLQDVELTVPEESNTDLSFGLPSFLTISNILRYPQNIYTSYLQTEHYYSRHTYSYEDDYVDDTSDDDYVDNTDEDDFVENFHEYSYFFDSD